MKPKLILVRGIPGSGKSTFAKTLGIADHYEADMWFEQNGGYDPAKLRYAHAWCLKKTLDAMKEGFDVVVSNTFTMLWEMDSYIDAANMHGYDIFEIIVDGGYKNVHGCPDDKVQKMKNRFEFRHLKQG